MPQIIKIEIFVLLLSLIFADRHGAICFQDLSISPVPGMQALSFLRECLQTTFVFVVFCEDH